jgi:hypothetical protein
LDRGNDFVVFIVRVNTSVMMVLRHFESVKNKRGKPNRTRDDKTATNSLTETRAREMEEKNKDKEKRSLPLSSIGLWCRS